MKKTILMTVLFSLFSLTDAKAQEDSATIDKNEIIAKGKWLIEANTNLGGGRGDFGMSSNTGFNLVNFNELTACAVGSEAGFFLMDKLALKLGLGYSSSETFKVFNYKLGAKYYAFGQIPFQVDITGGQASGESINPLWLGIQGGYVIFLTNNIGIEPAIRYNYSLNDDFTDKGIFEFTVGFSFYF